MFVPDRLKTNAFRVLRLSAEAALSDVHQAAGELRRAARLNAVTQTDADVPVLGDVLRSEADIRTAVVASKIPPCVFRIDCSGLIWPEPQAAKVSR